MSENYDHHLVEQLAQAKERIAALEAQHKNAVRGWEKSVDHNTELRARIAALECALSEIKDHQVARLWGLKGYQDDSIWLTCEKALNGGRDDD
jgi:hypothetical protein